MKKQIRKPRVSNLYLMRQLWKYYRNHKRYIFFVILLSFIGVIANIIATMIVSIAVGSLLSVLESSGPTFVRFCVIVGIMAACYVLYGVGLYLIAVFVAILNERAGYRLRQDLFFQLQHLPFSFLDSKSSGELVSCFTNDVSLFVQTFTQNMGQIISAFFTIIIVFIGLMLISPTVTLIAIALIPILFSLIFVFIKKAGPHFFKQQEFTGSVNAFVQEQVDAHKVIDLFNYQKASVDQFTKITNELANSSKHASNISGVIYPYNNFMNNVLLVAVTAILIAFNATGISLYGVNINSFLEQVLGISEKTSGVATQVTVTIAYIFLIRQFNTQISEIMSLSSQIQLAFACAARVFGVLNEKPIKETATKTKLVIKGSADICFNHVSFGYLPNTPVLKDLTFNLKGGTQSAIVGPTGSGKTTIISLLTRFYDINSGTISVDGEDISQYTRQALRENITIVLQDAVLFSQTIKENIRFGRMDATDDEIIQAAKNANAWNFIQELPHGIDTIISKEGGVLSEGQKQLIVIARAFLSKAKIIILDEATSYVDTKTELKIQEALQRLSQNRTTIVIAHRLSTIKKANKILVLLNGEIIEEGNHHELMSKQGFYYTMNQNGTALYED